MKTRERTLRLDKAIAKAKEEAKGQNGIDKRLTAIKTGSADEGDYESGIMRPSDEQLQKINQFTRTPKTADEVVVFNTLSCNDLLDRDDDKFTKDTVDGFAALEQPYSPIGKAFMVSHDYTKLPVGRIFDGEATTIKGTRWLKNSVYMPNTEQYKDFIENQDFGIYWAVSVGVMLEQMLCGLSWCGAEMYTSRFFGSFCMNGHDKSMWYLKDGETDDWGYPYPVEADTAGAEKCIGLMKGAKDFYELSQCFLGAQFYAALDKEAPGLGKVIKAASAKGVPVLGLSEKDAEAIPLQHVDMRVKMALAKGTAERDGDVVRWTDDEGLIWTFDPEVGEVQCLGKQNDPEDDEEDELDEPDEADESEDDTDTDKGAGDDANGEEDHDGSDEQLGRRRQADDPDSLGEDGGEQPPSGGGSGDSGVGDDREGNPGSEPAGGERDLTALQERLAVCRGKVASLGEAHTAAAADDESSDDNDASPVELAEAIDAVLDEASDAIDNQEYEQASSLLDSAETTVDELIDALGGTDADDNDEGKNAKGVEELSKKAVLAAATKARVPASILTKVNSAEGNGLDVLLREVVTTGNEAQARVKELEPQAQLGVAYLKELRAEAIDWYVKAHQEKDARPVTVENFTKILDACGDNHELIKTLMEEQRDAARAKFPAAVRRSGFETDPHARTTPEPVQQPDGDTDPQRSAAIRRIHG